MAEFASFAVRCFDAQYFTLQWEMANIPAGATYSFAIYRSEGTDGPWVNIAAGLTNRDIYHDWTVNPYNMWRIAYYKIVYTDDTPETIESSIQRVYNVPDAIAADIIRRQNLALRQINGTPGFFLIERTWGPRCQYCFNSTSQKVTISDCPYCYSTRYDGGYFEPIFGYVCQQGLLNINQNIAPIAETQQQVKRVWTSNVPVLKPRDIFVDNLNARWKIMAIDHTEKLGARMRQILTISEIPKGNIAYKYEVPNLYEFIPTRDYHVWDTVEIAHA